MKRLPLTPLALAVPILGLVAIWGWTDWQSRKGTDWIVPIEGYDPRDLLRGHYVQFTYDWPGAEDLREPYLYDFCIEGTPPAITRITAARAAEDCTHYAEARGREQFASDGLRRGRLYVPQTQARELQGKLLDRTLQAYVVIRQRPDGLITPQRLEFERRETPTGSPAP